jgi:DeoR family transcriptional regulator of aga operon
MVDRLGVSAVTVRKDLEMLEKRGEVLRIFGGAIPSRNTDLDATFQERARLHEHEKRLIGMAAAQLIQPGESVIIDAGSTTLEMVHHLRGIASLHVITAALNVALEAGALPLVTVIVTGTGTLDPITMSLEGPEVDEAFSRLHADKYFMGLRSVDLQHGFMDTNMRRIRVKQSMMRAARRTIALADSSKLGRSSLLQIAPLDSVSTLITDDAAPPAILDQLRSSGLQVIVADHPDASAPVPASTPSIPLTNSTG